jgi:hypothetical protein
MLLVACCSLHGWVAQGSVLTRAEPQPMLEHGTKMRLMRESAVGGNDGKRFIG